MIPLSTYEAAEKRLHALGDGARPTTAEAKAVRVLAQGPKRRPVKPAKSLGAATLHHEAVRKDEEVRESAEAAAAYKAVKRRDRRCTVQLPESIMGPCSGPLQIDHQWGRGKEPTLVTNCRRLCEAHHRRKTDGKPSRLVWLYDYAEHALSYAGLDPAYFAEVERAQNLAQLEKAQHPAASRSGAEGDGR